MKIMIGQRVKEKRYGAHNWSYLLLVNQMIGTSFVLGYHGLVTMAIVTHRRRIGVMPLLCMYL